MEIDPKKYTRAELAKMVEDTEEMRRSRIKECRELEEQLKSEKEKWITLRSDLVAKNQLIHALEAKSAALTEQIDQMNGEAINKGNEIANLRDKLSVDEKTIERMHDELEFKGTALNVMRKGRENAEQRANYAESHPWRNLWAWVKRKLGCKV